MDDDTLKHILSYLEPEEKFDQLYTGQYYKSYENKRYHSYRTNITCIKLTTIFKRGFFIDRLDKNYINLDIELIKKIINNIFTAVYDGFMYNEFFSMESMFYLLKQFSEPLLYKYIIKNQSKSRYKEKYTIGFLNKSKYLA